VVYSTAVDEPALDSIVDSKGGESENSPYTMTLAKEIIKPGRRLLETMDHTGMRVMEITDPKTNPRRGFPTPQTPEMFVTSGAGEFCFASCDDESLYGNRIVHSDNAVVVSEYLNNHPSGQYAVEASSSSQRDAEPILYLQRQQQQKQW